MAKTMWFTQEILFLTEHFGKKYFYMKDVDGHIYAVRAKPIYASSVDGTTGDAEKFIQGWEPDLT